MQKTYLKKLVLLILLLIVVIPNGTALAHEVYNDNMEPEDGPMGAIGTYIYGTNANKTGTGTGIVEGYDMSKDYKVRRADGNPYVHGQFKKNTNACASCHMTHTAAGGSLLLRNGVYNTCTACHDGTLGKLNVFDIPVYDSSVEAADYVNVGGGSFGGVVDTVYNASMHLARGSITLVTAPGGNKSLNADLNGDGINDTETESWTGDFDCSACHQPHGSYSDRLLVPNPANIERQALTVASWEVIGTQDGTNVWGAVYEGEVVEGPWLHMESYSLGKTQTVIYQAVYEVDVSITPMVVDPDKNQGDDGYILPSSVHLNDNFAINYAQGIATKKDSYTPPANLKIAIVPALVVKVDKGYFEGDGDSVPVGPYNVDVLGGGNSYEQGLDGTIIRWQGVNETTNLGKNGITWFCAGCHTDYYAEKYDAGGGLEGRYATAYRHTINRQSVDGSGEQSFVYEYGLYQGSQEDVLTCLSCHYAHGTTKQIMRNADDTQAQDADANPSSAIKRYVNMAVCWKCHGEELDPEFHSF
ncbi:cytochrome c3 family protein [Metallumcola ferriviriculae]|uniref:Cytochrome c3 family protein n=1 Tax=Metallumcola ferriviriculae TaxID=3039180 RepID=A0AAU0UKN9_9FIRM|nr:cytochrome c3 family protein [Desulfitibacteraceae bacterium MK1]